MPIPWMTVLKSIPWVEVIRNAPKVVDAARRLWTSVRSGRGASEVATVSPPTPSAGDGTVLRARLDAIEAELRELNEQGRATADLIKQLAEQNAGLVSRVELNRRRTVWLALTSGLSLAIALAAIWMARST